MNGALLFTLVAIVLYVVSDQIVKAIERRRGRQPLDNRTLVFFVIMFPLTVIAFQALQRLLDSNTSALP
jgi:hypothetical protein